MSQSSKSQMTEAEMALEFIRITKKKEEDKMKMREYCLEYYHKNAEKVRDKTRRKKLPKYGLPAEFIENINNLDVLEIVGEIKLHLEKLKELMPETAQKALVYGVITPLIYA